MQNHQTFDSKWKNIAGRKKDEEFSIFVPPSEKPRTQRQFNLYNYYEFISSVIRGRGYKDAVEIGCGRGTIALYMTVYEKLRVICSDSEKSAIYLAMKNFVHFNSTAQFIIADAAKLPIPSESIDISVSIGLLEHLPVYREILKEQFRILRPGGVIISLNIPKKHSVQDLNRIYRFVYRLLKPSYPLKPDYFRNTDRPVDYLKQAEMVGFTNAYNVNVNPFPIFTPLLPRIELLVTLIYRFILGFRRIYSRYPFKTNYALSQAHFLVGFKKK